MKDDDFAKGSVKPPEEVIQLDAGEEVPVLSPAERKELQRSSKGKGKGRKGGGKGSKKGKGKGKGEPQAKPDEGLVARVAKYARPTKGTPEELKVKHDRKRKGQAKLNQHLDREAAFRAAKAEVLQTAEPGLIETEEAEDSTRLTQKDILDSAGVGVARKYFSFDLPYGPYNCCLTRNGAHLLVGGRKGHVAFMHLDSMKIFTELHVKETVRAVQTLHNENLFAVAQKSLRESQEALRQETEALRAALSAPAKVRAATAGHAAPMDRASATTITETRPRRISVCSTSSGSEAGAASTCSRRSGGTSGASSAKVKTRTDPMRSRDAPAVTRSAQRSSSAPTTPRGASAPRAVAPRAATPRRSASGEAAQRSATPRRSRAKLFEVAQPLLQQGIPKEKRVIALSAFARCLKEGASPSHWDGPQSPLRSAVQAQDSDMARLLLQARADPNDRDAKGVCVLHSASFDGLSDLCQSLLKARADANAADQHGQTAFFFAPSSKVCDVLLEGKADVNAVNQKGQSALHLASRAGLSEVLHWMAPRVSHEVMELRDVHGATAAYYARHAGIGYDFLRHRFSAEAAGEDKSEKRTGRHNLEPVESQARERTRSSWTSLARRDLALAPVLEDQLDGEEEEVPVATAAADVEEVPVATAAVDVEETPEAPETPEAELPGSSTTVPPEEHQELEALDMEVTSCFLEDCPESPKALETSLAEHEPKEETSTLEAPDRSAPEGSSPASSLERADQMVTWEEDCGCPGFALTASTADLSLGDSPVAEASDVSDTASPGKAARSKRRSSRSSLNQVFLRPLDPLKAEKTES